MSAPSCSTCGDVATTYAEGVGFFCAIHYPCSDRERDTIAPDDEKTGAHHMIPSSSDEQFGTFTRVVGELVQKAVESAFERSLDERFRKLTESIDSVLVFTQRVVQLETTVAAQGREIEDLKAWRKEAEARLGMTP